MLLSIRNETLTACKMWRHGNWYVIWDTQDNKKLYTYHISIPHLMRTYGPLTLKPPKWPFLITQFRAKCFWSPFIFQKLSYHQIYMQNVDDHINTESPYEVIPITVTPQKLYIVTEFPYQFTYTIIIPFCQTPCKRYSTTDSPIELFAVLQQVCFLNCKESVIICHIELSSFYLFVL